MIEPHCDENNSTQCDSFVCIHAIIISPDGVESCASCVAHLRKSVEEHLEKVEDQQPLVQSLVQFYFQHSNELFDITQSLNGDDIATYHDGFHFITRNPGLDPFSHAQLPVNVTLAMYSRYHLNYMEVLSILATWFLCPN